MTNLPSDHSPKADAGFPTRAGAGDVVSRLGWLVALIAFALFALTALPYLLPKGGPQTVHPATLADPDGAFLQVEGESLYYEHVPGPGPVVVLMHGFGGSSVTWWQTMPALTVAGYDVYAVDLVGFGLSDKGSDHDYSHPAQARRVIGLMDALGIDHATIVGHSMGGDVAAHLALSYPDRVDRLVLVNAAILGGGEGLLPVSVPDIVLNAPFVQRWAQVGLSWVLAPMFENLLYDAAYRDDAILPAFEAGYRRALNTPGWELGLLGITRDGDRNALPASVSAIRVPTLILWGARDTWVSPGDGVQLERMIPGAERVQFDDVGHLPMHETPDAFNAALLDFLRKTDG